MNQIMSMKINTRYALILLSCFSIICAILAYCVPFMYIEFILELPDWVPDFISGRLQDWIVQQGNVETGPQYILLTIYRLFQVREYFIGAAIAVFSVMFPFLKIGLILYVSILQSNRSSSYRNKLIKLISFISNWSMADVFIVGILIVFIKADGFHFRFTSGPGIYFYAMAAILSGISFKCLAYLVNIRPLQVR